MKNNKLGGIDYTEKEHLERAENADLITLPDDVEGTNCSNCKFVKILDETKGGGFCMLKKVNLPVTKRMCCKFWDNKGASRSWEKK